MAPLTVAERMAESLKNRGEKVIESRGACELVWTRDGFTEKQIEEFGMAARKIARTQLLVNKGDLLL